MKVQTGNIFFDGKSFKPNDQLPYIILDHPKTPENIGSIMRLAGNLGIRELFIIGKEEDYRLSKVKKASSTAWGLVKLIFCNTESLIEFNNEGIPLIAIETCENASNIYNFNFPEKFAIVLGNEAYGISENTLKLCDKALFIPLPGKVKSMNVSQAATATMFEWYRQTCQ